MAKAKVKVKSKGKGQSTPKLIGKTKVRTTAHLLINKDGQPRRKGW
ncbi:MAG: hypothetical protein K2M94_05970 [Paramuribaculum sp.]|nr:hypothetical protein [Paramuribaculum sp.]